MYGLIGVVIGLLLNFLIIKPIEKRRFQDECIRTGLAPECLEARRIVKE